MRFTERPTSRWAFDGLATPDWGPLERVARARAPDDAEAILDDFMWLGRAVAPGVATVVQVYKHRWTRRALALSDDGQAYCYRGTDGAYVPVPLAETLAHVLDTDPATLRAPGRAGPSASRAEPRPCWRSRPPGEADTSAPT